MKGSFEPVSETTKEQGATSLMRLLRHGQRLHLRDRDFMTQALSSFSKCQKNNEQL